MSHQLKVNSGPIVSELASEDSSFTGIIVEFVNGLPERLRVMEDSLQMADFQALANAAHQLKGSGGGYGYPMLTEQAGKLEMMAKHRAQAACAELVANMKALCARIVVST